MSDSLSFSSKETSVIELTVTNEHAGLRLDQFLTALLPEQSRSKIQRFIKKGLVRIGSKIGRPNMSVKSDDIVTFTVPPLSSAIPQPEPLPIEIVYDDPHLLVVNKPAGMVVHPAAGHADGTLVNALLHHVKDLSGIGGEKRPGIVHRLDRGTSGLIVVAKHDVSHRELARQFKDREVEKEYIALVWGVVQSGRRIDESIGRDRVHRQRMSTRTQRARSAVTRVTKAEHLCGLSLLRVAIFTGRTHQIRVHLSTTGHPVVGDSLYGGRHRHLPPQLRPLLQLERPFLHAAHLSFAHPHDHRQVKFSCDLPVDLNRILNELRALSHA